MMENGTTFGSVFLTIPFGGLCLGVSAFGSVSVKGQNGRHFEEFCSVFFGCMICIIFLKRKTRIFWDKKNGIFNEISSTLRGFIKKRTSYRA